LHPALNEKTDIKLLRNKEFSFNSYNGIFCKKKNKNKNISGTMHGQKNTTL